MDRPRPLRAGAQFPTALGLCEGGRAPLAGVIALGDGIQHATMTRDAVNGAIGRLGRGYVTRSPERTLGLSDAGQALVAEATRERGLLPRQRPIERLLPAAAVDRGVQSTARSGR